VRPKVRLNPSKVLTVLGHAFTSRIRQTNPYFTRFTPGQKAAAATPQKALSHYGSPGGPIGARMLDDTGAACLRDLR